MQSVTPSVPLADSHAQRLPSADAADAAGQMLSMLERAAFAGSWALELQSGHLTWTDQLAALLALPHGGGAAINHPLVFYAPESQQIMASALEACAASAVPFDQEVQAVTTLGQRLWVRTLGRAIRNPSGEVVSIHGMLLDLTERKRVEHESLGVTMRLGTTLASLTEAFVTLDRECRFTYLNHESERLLMRKSSELLGLRIWDELDDNGSGRLRREMRAVISQQLSAEFEEFFPLLGKWLEVRAYPFEDGIAVYFRDVTASRQSQEQLLLLQTSISRLNDIVLITEAGSVDAPGPRIVFVNDAFERHTGYSREEVIGQTPRLLQGPLTQTVELNRIRKALRHSQPVRAELINYKKNGDQFWLELEIVPVEYLGRGLTHWVSVARDITQRKAAEDEIEHLAFYDALTQLPNRQLLMNRLQNALSQGADNLKIGTLMFIDLDNFKILNDTLGHSKGDLLLQKVASRLAASVRRGDTVARLGGDEFVVMLEDLGEDVPSAAAMSKIIGEQILATLSEPYDLAGYQHHGTCSIGITSFSRHKESIGDLLKQADLAMYQAKAAGRNAVCFFDPQMQAAATANAALGSELRQALRNQEFLLHYQPQVGPDGLMVGVEALVRWQHPERGLVFPDEFIAQAEESGLILPMGQWVLEVACNQLASWSRRAETEKLSIAVNVSVRQFRHPEFVEQLMTILNRTGVHASRLKLELTETLLATGMDATIAKMGRLKSAGVTLAIDDFGMGYSALSYLKHLPLDQLKIDRAFVKDVLRDPNDAAIARTIIGLAQSLGLAVMAEGVETEAQRDFLARHGCEYYQGHLFCEALPIDQLEAFMQGLSV